MNRADLDRCIGDLYPILSHSVTQVVPAGLPGVRGIQDNEKFRIVATVNDATLDDIVFPISEGLARRFVRLELRGATLEDISAFVAVDGAPGERVAAAKDAVSTLFDLARQAERISADEDGEHLPFGVGYFALLQAWVAGKLELQGEVDATAQARRALVLALRSMARARSFDAVLQQLEA